MNVIKTFLDQYLMTIIYAALTAIVGALGAIIKKKYTEWADSKTKKDVVKTVVYAVQQLYKDLDGEEKKKKAIEQIVAMLAEKGISITEIEIDLLIEACVAEAKNAFEGGPQTAKEEDLTFETEDGYTFYYDGDKIADEILDKPKPKLT